MANKLLKAKPRTAESHNPELSNLIDKVKEKADVPFQVRLDIDLAKRVRVFSAESDKSHKQIVTEALEAYLPAEKN